MTSETISPTLLAAAPDFSRRFSVTLEGLRTVVARYLLRDPRLALIVIPLWSRLGRAMARFERLMARLAAGRLPLPPRPRQAGAAANPVAQPPQPPKPPIPTAHGWLTRALEHRVAAYGWQLQHLLAQPGMDELLAISPTAGRILRPLCHMLGLPNPTPRQPVPSPHATPLRAPAPSNPEAQKPAPADGTVLDELFALYGRPSPPRPARPPPPAPQLKAPCPHLQWRWPWYDHTLNRPR